MANIELEVSEMVERVAAAMAVCGQSHTSWDQCADNFKDEMRRKARAAIEAMREPTPEIIEALERLLDIQGHSHTPKESWALLVDEALR